jgi:hypothetical protein
MTINSDPLSTENLARIRQEYEAAAAERRALLVRNAPWWMRALALLPNPRKPLEDWVSATKAKMRGRF